MFFRCLFLRVLSSSLIKFVLSENSCEWFFEIYRSALPVFLFFSLFFLFILTLLLPALYNDFCVKTTLDLVTLVFQETGDKTKKQRALWCYNARAVTNHIADFAPLRAVFQF